MPGDAVWAIHPPTIRACKKPSIVAELSQRRDANTPREGHGAPLQILAGFAPRRTSKPKICPAGFSEPTATIVWGTLLKLGLPPTDFVLWNAFPWHSFEPRRGMLSNRMPNKPEQAAGLPVLKAFLELFQCEQVVALGKIAAAQLEKLSVQSSQSHANITRNFRSLAS